MPQSNFRLLCFSYEYPPLGGGGARVVDGLVRELSRQGVPIDVFTMGMRKLQATEVIEDVAVHRVGRMRLRLDRCTPAEMAVYLPLALRALTARAQKVAYSINHTHFIFPDGVLARQLRKRTGLPYVLTAHGSDVPGYNPDRFVGLHRWLHPLWKAVVRDAEVVVCPSRSIEELILKKLPDARTQVIHNGIDIHRFATGAERTPSILVVSRLFERKGVQYLLQALAQGRPSCRVDIVGDGPYRDRLAALAKELDVRATFHGWLDNGSDELRRLYETSQIFAYPSVAENFPVALLEAMAAGLAIITTRGTGCEEVVGDTAVLTDAGDVDGLAGAIDALLSDPAYSHGKARAARIRAETIFHWPAVAAQYSALLASAASHDAGGSPKPLAAAVREY